jgi:hypothetical protein
MKDIRPQIAGLLLGECSSKTAETTITQRLGVKQNA